MKPFLFLCLLLYLLVYSPLSVTSPIVVTDYHGREVVLKQPAKRIVALGPHIVENIFTAGAGDLIVGAVSHSDFPEEAKSIARVGDIQGYSIEKIISLSPDLVMVWPSGVPAQTLQKLLALGLPLYFDEPKVLTDIAKSIEDVGKLTGRENLSGVVAENYLTKLSDLSAIYQSKASVSVLYQVWNQPLQTLNNQHIISDVIRLCGGRNAFGDAPVLAPKINIETVLHRNPDVIVASGIGEDRPDWLDDWLMWPALTAVNKKQLFFIPPDWLQRHTVRILQGAQLLCDQLESVRNKSAAL